MRGNTLKLIVVLAALLILTAILIVYLARPQWTIERVQDTVISTLQNEEPAVQIVGGTVEVTASREISDRGRFSWVPDWLGAPMLFGAEARVQVSGLVHYGIDGSDFSREHITVTPEGVIEIEIPEIRIIAVEPRLSQMTIRHTSGILRPGADLPLRDEALADLEAVLREQGQRHIYRNVRSIENVARAMVGILTPAFEAAGMEDPRFRFKLADGVILDTSTEEKQDVVTLPNP